MNKNIWREHFIPGALGGLAGVLIGHVLVTISNKTGAALWFKGPFDPPFFSLALYLGVMCAAIAWALSRRKAPAALGFFGPFLGIIVPLFAITRDARWYQGGKITIDQVIGLVYILALWGTFAGLGALMPSRRRWLGALAALGGAFGGFLIWKLIFLVLPEQIYLWRPTNFIPSPGMIFDGVLTGMGLALSLALTQGPPLKTSNKP